jgi:hypothetical protein
VDAFAAKLSPSGDLLWNTFLGSSGSDDYGYAITLGSDGNLHLAGTSNFGWGDPRRAYSGSEDYFVAKLDSSGNLLWNTFLGGSGRDSGYAALGVDGSGNIYTVGGNAANWGSPVRAYSYDEDAFAVKQDGSGNLLWNTFLGGGGIDWGIGITVDSSGNFIWTKGMGEASDDLGYDIAVDSGGNVYITGMFNFTADFDPCAWPLPTDPGLRGGNWRRSVCRPAPRRKFRFAWRGNPVSM